MFKHRRAQGSYRLLTGALAVTLLSLGGPVSGCVDADENANLARYDGSWTVVTVNGATPIRAFPGVKIASPNLEISVSCNRVGSTGILRENLHFVQTGGARSLINCNDQLNALDEQIADLMSSHPLFTDHPDGTLSIEAAPYSLVLRRQ